MTLRPPGCHEREPWGIPLPSIQTEPARAELTRHGLAATSPSPKPMRESENADA